MRVVIFCGGYGSRLGHETQLRPKPMVLIGDAPILVHIMKIYINQGHKRFIIPLGYRGEVIKEYFNIPLGVESPYMLDGIPINILLIETGVDTGTAKRLFLVRDFLKGETDFMVTYGDGLGNINLTALKEFHEKHGRVGTMSVVRPPARFGQIDLDHESQITSFVEKAPISNAWINGGFFIFNKKIFNYLDDRNIMLESTPLVRLTQDSQLMGFKHDGFWYCMDTTRDKRYLEELYQSNNIPWLI